MLFRSSRKKPMKFYQIMQISNTFQTTFNEHGLCYTFNNVDQGMEDRFRKAESDDHDDDDLANLEQEKDESQSAPVTIRKVTGCGRNHGFQLVVDTQQLMTLLPKAHLALGFKVFVSQPGVVTSRDQYNKTVFALTECTVSCYIIIKMIPMHLA